MDPASRETLEICRKWISNRSHLQESIGVRAWPATLSEITLWPFGTVGFFVGLDAYQFHNCLNGGFATMKNSERERGVWEHSREGSPKALLQWLLVLIIPLLVVCVGFQLRHASGPFWLGTNYDPAYSYLLNSLSIAHFHPPAHTDHPGTSLQLFGAAAVKLTHWTVGTGTLESDLLTRPEFYLTVIWIAALVTLATLLFLIGLWVFRETAEVSTAILLQVSPLLSPACFSELPHVAPEILLLTITSALGAVVLIHIRQAASLSDQGLAVLGGILVGLAMATKLTAIPIVFLPAVVLPRWRTRIRYGLFAFGTFFLVMIPVIVGGELRSSLVWIYRLIVHTGLYGSGSAGLLDVAKYSESLTTLLRNDPSLCAAILISLGIFIWSSPKFGPTSESDCCQMMRKGLLAVTSVQIVQVLMVAKHPAGRYLLPSLGLLGLNLALIAGIVQETVHGSSRSVSHVVAGLLLVTLLTFQAPQYLWLKAALTNEKQAQLMTSEEAKRYRGARLIHSFGCSSQSFALLFGNRWAGWRFARELEKHYADVFCHSPFKNFYFNTAGKMLPEALPRANSRIVYWGTYLKQGHCDVADDLELLYAPSSKGLRFHEVDKIYQLKKPLRHLGSPQRDQP